MEDLSPKQQDAFLNSNARINIFEGPVRAGKSFVSLLRWVDFCVNGAEGPLVIVGKTEFTIKRNIITPLMELVGPAVHYAAHRREVRIGSRLMHVVSANDDRAEAKIRGSEFAGALVDEATLMPESFFKMLLSRLSVPGAKLFASTNPDSPYHWLKKDFIDVPGLDLKDFRFTIRDNPSLTDEYIQNLSREYRGLWHQRYIDGLWVQAEGSVYDFFDYDIHTITYHPTANYYIVGVDYGTTNPTAFALIGVNPSEYPNCWLENEYYYDSSRRNIQKSDFEYAQDLSDFCRGLPIKAIYMDPSAASLRQELVRQCFQIHVHEANNDVLPGIRFVSNELSSGAFKIVRNCEESIREITSYAWDPRASQRGVDAPLKRNDHACDAIRYALASHFSGSQGHGGMEEREADAINYMLRKRW